MHSPNHSARVGEEYLGCVIAEILGQSSRVLVYTTTDNQLRWAYLQDEGALPQELKPAMSEFDSLMTSIKTYVPPHHQKIAYVNLGKSLFVALDPAPATKVPDEVRAFTSKDRTTEEFIAMSRELANYLFAQHTGATSPGLLCVMEVAVGQKRGIAVLKLERQEGAEIKFSGEEGKRVFDFDVLENLILTDKTRLFKSALFVRTAPGDDDFDSHGCDSQGPGTSEDVARFWLTYLGCQLAEEPRVSTRKWFDASLAFANEEIGDPVQMNDFYEHIHSELKSNRKNVSPKQFIEDYVPAPLRVPYRNFLEEHRVSLQAFGKDISEIKTRLRKKAFHTSHGISVTVPEEEENLVKVKADQIVVHDNLVSVDHK